MSDNYAEAARLLELSKTVASIDAEDAAMGMVNSRAIAHALLAVHDRLDQFFTELVAVLETAKQPNEESR